MNALLLSLALVPAPEQPRTLAAAQAQAVKEQRLLFYWVGQQPDKMIVDAHKEAVHFTSRTWPAGHTPGNFKWGLSISRPHATGTTVMLWLPERRFDDLEEFEDLFTRTMGDRYPTVESYDGVVLRRVIRFENTPERGWVRVGN
jgi:hypothetical protein